MSAKEKQLLLQYFIHRAELLEDEFRQLRANLRFRKIDSADCIECSIALERMAAFKEFSHDVMQLLKLSDSQSDPIEFEPIKSIDPTEFPF